jgi:hypothetical protein
MTYLIAYEIKSAEREYIKNCEQVTKLLMDLRRALIENITERQNHPLSTFTVIANQVKLWGNEANARKQKAKQTIISVMKSAGVDENHQSLTRYKFAISEENKTIAALAKLRVRLPSEAIPTESLDTSFGSAVALNEPLDLRASIADSFGERDIKEYAAAVRSYLVVWSRSQRDGFDHQQAVKMWKGYILRAQMEEEEEREAEQQRAIENYMNGTKEEAKEEELDAGQRLMRLYERTPSYMKDRFIEVLNQHHKDCMEKQKSEDSDIEPHNKTEKHIVG